MYGVSSPATVRLIKSTSVTRRSRIKSGLTPLNTLAAIPPCCCTIGLTSAERAAAPANFRPKISGPMFASSPKFKIPEAVDRGIEEEIYKIFTEPKIGVGL